MTPEERESLAAKLPQELVAHRKAGRDRETGRNVMVPYIEGFVAIEQANRLFGFDGWDLHVEAVQYLESARGYTARVTVTALGRTRQDVGFCATQGDSAEAHDMGLKGAVTDAMKRALRTFGNQFGNALYDKDPAPTPASAPPPAATPPPPTTAAPASVTSPTAPVSDMELGLFTAEVKRLGYMGWPAVCAALNTPSMKAWLSSGGTYETALATLRAAKQQRAGAA